MILLCKFINSLKAKLTAACTLICLLPTPTSFAQGGDAERYKNWYQIETIIFSRGLGVYSNEALPKNIVLAYPTNVRYLKDAHENENIVDDSQTNQLEQVLAKSSQPKTFTRLKPSERKLNIEKNAIARQRGHKILYHAAWRQPVYNSKEATSVIIEGGGKFGDHYELEGAITVTLSRYLHTRTNFWITQFEANYGQENYHWPDLPNKPIDVFSSDPLENAQGILKPSNTAQTDHLNSSSLFSQSGQASTKYTLRTSSIANDDVNYAKKPHMVKKIHTIKQSRKMRSGELHYIDHPLSGMIVLIEPYRPTNSQGASQAQP